MKLDDPKLCATLLEEPPLEFACARLHLSPKHGLTVFGPRSLDMRERHPEAVRLAFIGSGQSVASAKTRLDTKINWNTASFAGLLPITLRFSKVVGEIMTEIPRERAPLPQFKFYM